MYARIRSRRGDRRALRPGRQPRPVRRPDLAGTGLPHARDGDLARPARAAALAADLVRAAPPAAGRGGGHRDHYLDKGRLARPGGPGRHGRCRAGRAALLAAGLVLPTGDRAVAETSGGGGSTGGTGTRC